MYACWEKKLHHIAELKCFVMISSYIQQPIEFPDIVILLHFQVSFRRKIIKLLYCHSLVLMERRLCTSLVDPALSLAPFLSCHLITLDKNPGVHPIGIGEVVRRIVAKAALSVLGILTFRKWLVPFNCVLAKYQELRQQYACNTQLL